jgi:hypothetical protein
MLMEALLRPRALERFFFGMAIRSLYRVAEFATQGVKCGPSFVARFDDARALGGRKIGAALRAQPRTIVSA